MDLKSAGAAWSFGSTLGTAGAKAGQLNANKKMKRLAYDQKLKDMARAMKSMELDDGVANYGRAEGLRGAIVNGNNAVDMRGRSDRLENMATSVSSLASLS